MTELEKALKDIDTTPHPNGLRDGIIYYNEHFSKTIAKIDIDDIHWIKNQGYYSIKVDNFKGTNKYSISIKGNEVEIVWFEDGYSEKVSEDKIKEVYDIGEYEVMESATYWRFKWKNQKLVFIESVMAG